MDAAIAMLVNACRGIAPLRDASEVQRKRRIALLRQAVQALCGDTATLLDASHFVRAGTMTIVHGTKLDADVVAGVQTHAPPVALPSPVAATATSSSQPETAPAAALEGDALRVVRLARTMGLSQTQMHRLPRLCTRRQLDARNGVRKQKKYMP